MYVYEEIKRYIGSGMGRKSLSMQMIPWCFHIVGGACRPTDHHGTSGGGNDVQSTMTVRLIGWDGRIIVYHRPVMAADLMKEYPRHLVCRSDDCFIGQKVPPLAAGDQLQPGHFYLLLPSHLFHSALSFVTLAASLGCPPPAVDGTGVKSGKNLLWPFDIHKTASGTLQIRVSDEFLLERVRELEQERKSSRVITSEALEKEYKMLVRCKSRQWRPKLVTISESHSTLLLERWRIGLVRYLGGSKRMKQQQSQ